MGFPALLTSVFTKNIRKELAGSQCLEMITSVSLWWKAFSCHFVSLATLMRWLVRSVNWGWGGTYAASKSDLGILTIHKCSNQLEFKRFNKCLFPCVCICACVCLLCVRLRERENNMWKHTVRGNVYIGWHKGKTAFKVFSFNFIPEWHNWF